MQILFNIDPKYDATFLSCHVHTWLFPTVATIQAYSYASLCTAHILCPHSRQLLWCCISLPVSPVHYVFMVLSSQRLVPLRKKDTPFWQFLWFRQGQGWLSMERWLTGMFILSWNVNTKMYGTIGVKYKLMLFLCSLSVQCNYIRHGIFWIQIKLILY